MEAKGLKFEGRRPKTERRLLLGENILFERIACTVAL
jgi:hypothetical protein